MNDFANVALTVSEPETSTSIRCGRWINGNKVCGEPCVLVFILDRNAPLAFGLCVDHQGLNLRDMPIDRVLAVPTQIAVIEEKLNQIGERQDEIAAIFAGDDLTEKQVEHARRIRDTLVEILGPIPEKTVEPDLGDDPDSKEIYESNESKERGNSNEQD